MKRLVAGMVLGVLVVSVAQAQERQKEEPRITKLEALVIGTVGGSSFSIPETYGRLVNVVVSSEVHYLYFEDGAGTIRVMQVGPRGAVQRSRNPLQLLSPDVFVMKRGPESAPQAGS